MEPAKTEKKPFSWLGCGCAGIFFTLLVLIAGMTWVSYRAGKDLQADVDPVTRATRFQRVLPYRDLPPGYHAWGASSIPFMMKTAVLSDREPPAPGSGDAGNDLGRHGFFYMSFRAPGGPGDRLRQFIQGEKGGGETSIEMPNFKLDVRQPLQQGTFQAGSGKVRYGLFRGQVSPMGSSPTAVLSSKPQATPEPPRPAVMALLQIDCPKDNWAHLAIWYGPDPAPNQPAKGAPFAGTPADPAAVENFMGYFDVCGGR
jgi:hypothetical protein